MMRALTDPIFADLQQKLEEWRGKMTGVLRIGSMCSGIGTPEMISEIFAECWNQKHPSKVQATGPAVESVSLRWSMPSCARARRRSWPS